MAKLVAIGDSLTQGFQSGAILRTTWSFPAIIARSLDLNTPNDFPIPTFPGNGLPLNIEEVLHKMEKELGNKIDTAEWIIRFPILLRNFMNEVEDLYERGTGSRPVSFGGYYHNLAVFGFKIVDSFKIDGSYCREMIRKEEGWIEDDFLGLPSAPMYRAALRVLNPKLEKNSRDHLTQLGNLKKIVETEKNLDCLILWLGSNECLGTVIDLEVKEMPEDITTNDPDKRRKYNLTHPTIFEKDYNRLISEVQKIIPSNTQVFVGTVPHVTIPPVTQGIPPFDGTYFERYGRFFANPNNFSDRQKHLKKAEIQKIDATVDQFNQIIERIIEPLSNFHLVKIGEVLDSLAVKRNNLSGNPDQALRNYYNNNGMPNHPLLQLSPVPSILRFELQDRRRVSGGIFSLDCVHPSTIGYGIVAEVFLEEMQKAGVANADPIRLNWAEIIAHDSLLNAPPLHWQSVLEAAENNAILWDNIFKVLL